jgi:hypothetical protein
VPTRKIKVFYPGQASLEWVMNKADHSAVPDIVDKKRPAPSAMRATPTKSATRSSPASRSAVPRRCWSRLRPRARPASIPVTFQAAHDGNKIYFRFEWVPPKIGDKKMDPKNEVKLTMMFDGGGTVEGSGLNGCWGQPAMSTCAP